MTTPRLAARRRAAPTNGAAGSPRPAAPVPVPVPAAIVERLAAVLDYAYEAAWHLCDRGRADWSTLGEPITEALMIARAIRDDARRLAA